ncbi:MAG: hypothetical protein J0H69_19465 [Burkholderiales bacterium]|nr:hypothetical protein [Burkholderiales bacterium]
MARELIVGALLAAGLMTGALLAIRSYGAGQYDRGKAEATTTYERAIDRQKLDAAATLATETARAAAAEQTMREMRAAQEKKNVDNEKKLADAQDALRAERLRNGGRLYDPHAEAGGCGRGGGSAEAATTGRTGEGASPPAQAGGLLSLQLSDLLDRLLREADEVNEAYAQCRADVYTVRGQPAP